MKPSKENKEIAKMILREANRQHKIMCSTGKESDLVAKINGVHLDVMQITMEVMRRLRLIEKYGRRTKEDDKREEQRVLELEEESCPTCGPEGGEDSSGWRATWED